MLAESAREVRRRLGRDAPGSTAVECQEAHDESEAQRELRDKFLELKTKNQTSKLEKVSAEKQTKHTRRIYKNFWRMVEHEGGLVNR